MTVMTPSNFLTIFLTFFYFKKILFNEIWTIVSMWKHYSKWRFANSTMSGLHKYNVKTNARLVLQHYLMNKNELLSRFKKNVVSHRDTSKINLVSKIKFQYPVDIGIPQISDPVVVPTKNRA
jgi:hypothetical protein